MKYQSCSECGAKLVAHWLKNGVCNGCRNPHLIVAATTEGDEARIQALEAEGLTRSDAQGIVDLENMRRKA